METVNLDNSVALRRDASDSKGLSLWPRFANSGEPVAWAWLFGLTVAAGVLRLFALNQQLWFDEIVTLLDSAREPIWRIVTHYGGQNQHMLYSVLAHGSIRLLGEQPWALRLPAVLFGVASIPAVYFFARQVTTNREALFASALMTINYQHIWFSQNARGYTGMVFWALLSSIFFIRCASDGNKRDSALYGVSAALGIYTHLMMAFVVVGHVILYAWLLASRARSAGQRRTNFFPPLFGLVLAGVVSFLLYAPVIPGIFARTIGEAGKSVRYEWASPVWALWEMLRGLRASTGGGLIAVMLGGLIVLSGLKSYWRENRFVVGLMVLPGLATAAAVLATGHNFWPRFFFFEIGFGLLMLVRGAMICADAVAIMLGSAKRFGLQIRTVMVGLMLLASVPPLRAAYFYPKQDYAAAMRFVEGQRQPDEQIVTVGVVSTPYQRYYSRPWPLLETRVQLDAVLEQTRNTWLIYAMPISIRASQPEMWEAIQNNFTITRTFPGTLGGGEIYVCKSRNRDEQSNSARSR
jgi:mannosyltransferase